MTPHEKVFAIFALLLFCAWLAAWWVDETLNGDNDE